MKKILVATHGKFASGIMNSVELFAGPQENVKTIDAYTDDSDFSKKISEFLDEVEESDEIVIFTDLYGGSVNQKVVELVSERKMNIHIITGFNLPVLLEIILFNDELSEEIIKEFIERGPVMKVENLNMKTNISNESFFN